MLDYLKGQLAAKKPGRVVIETGGLGFEVLVPLGTFLALPEPPSQITLLTKLIIREESWEIFGFSSPLERESFLALTSVSRIGPRLALTIISAMEPGDLARALMARDLAAISAIKGIGTKTAERLLVELKDKAPKLAVLAGLPKTSGTVAEPAAAPPGLPPDDEALSALLNLGYTNAEAGRALNFARQNGCAEADLGDLLRHALKFLTK